MEEAREMAERENCDTIELDVNVKNESAKEFYRKHGFEMERERMLKYI